MIMGGRKMSSFDKVIGYEAIKTELRQICDVIQNRRVYEELGARLPHGLLLYGNGISEEAMLGFGCGKDPAVGRRAGYRSEHGLPKAV